MNLSLLVLNQVSIMLLLMALGYYAYKKKILSPQGSKDLSLILMYLVTPAVQLKSFMIESSPEKTQIFFNSIGFGLLAFVVSVLIAHLLYRKNGTYNFGVTFSNAGFIGIPLVYNTLGSEAVFYILSYLAMSIIGMWTYGVFVLTKRPDSISFKKILRNPIITFVFIGLFLYFTQIKLPPIGVDILNFIAPLNTPLAMFVIGSLLAEIPFKSIFNDLKVYPAVLARLILVPVVTGIVFSFIPLQGEQATIMKIAIFIISAAPAGANTAILPQIFGLDATQGVKMVCLSTILSILTIPALVFLFERLIA